MKKIALMSLFVLSAGTLTAQNNYQVPNGDFEGEWTTQTRGQYTENTPASWNSFYSANTSALGSFGNIAFSMNQVGQLSQEAANPHGGRYSAKIASKSNLIGSISNGNLTTGIINMGSTEAANAQNYNYSDMTNPNGCLPFAGYPDALKVWLKFNPKNQTTGNASVNAVLHTDAGYRDPNASMTAEEEAAARIAKAYSEVTSNVSTENPTGTWQEYVVPFVYNEDIYKTYTGQKYLLISFSTNKNPGVGSDGDELYIDDIELVYNSQLTSLTYDGEPISGFATDNYGVLDMSTVDYDPSKLAYTSNGAGATVTRKFDATGLLTLTVSGNDVSINPDNVHTYKVQFAQPLVTSISVAGEPLADFDPSVSDITLPFPYDKSLVFAFSTSVGMYNGGFKPDDAAKTATLAVESGDRQSTYTLHFTDAVADAPLSGTYGGSLSVVLMGQDTELANAPIDITINTDGTANLTLKDFTFMDAINVGDIYVPHIPVSDGTTLNATRTISFPHGMVASYLGELPVTVSATIIGEGQLEAAIDIDTKGSELAFGTIHVDFTPLVLGETTDDAIVASGRLTKEGATLLALSKPQEKRYVDLSGATVDDDVLLTDLFGESEAPNTLVYLPADATLAGDNVIVGTECQKLVLTEDAAFYAPKAFTAAEVSFDREFATGRVSTFVMPFTFSVPEGMSVTKLSKVEGTTLTFSPVTTAEAGTPYLIEATTARPFDALTDVEVAATSTTDVTVSGVTHHGAFDSESVTSGETTYYGWNENGEFVNATTGTLTPFRTYLTTSAAQAAPAFKVVMNKPTGIDTVTTTPADGTLYDLSGRRVEKAAKGLYIQGGKKVYIK